MIYGSGDEFCDDGMNLKFERWIWMTMTMIMFCDNKLIVLYPSGQKKINLSSQSAMHAILHRQIQISVPPHAFRLVNCLEGVKPNNLHFKKENLQHIFFTGG